MMAGSQLAVATDSPVSAHPTIRAISGGEPIVYLASKSTALVVIDFQNEYFTGRMPIPDEMAALKNTQRLIDFVDKANISVIHVSHVTPPGSAVFALDGKTVDFYPQKS